MCRGSALRIGLHQQREAGAFDAVGDPGLGAVDDVIVAVAPRRHADGLQIGAGVGLGQRKPAADLAARKRRQPVPLLRRGAELLDRERQHQVRVEDAGDRHPHRGDAHDDLGVGRGRQAEAAVFGADGRAEQAEAPASARRSWPASDRRGRAPSRPASRRARASDRSSPGGEPDRPPPRSASCRMSYIRPGSSLRESLRLWLVVPVGRNKSSGLRPKRTASEHRPNSSTEIENSKDQRGDGCERERRKECQHCKTEDGRTERPADLTPLATGQVGLRDQASLSWRCEERLPHTVQQAWHLLIKKEVAVAPIRQDGMSNVFSVIGPTPPGGTESGMT